MALGSVVNGDEDPARKAHKLVRVIKDFQSYFMEIEKVIWQKRLSQIFV